MKAYLIRAACPVGKIINVGESVCRVLKHLSPVDCLPGGRGVSQMELEPLSIRYPATRKELRKLNGERVISYHRTAGLM